MTQRKLLGTLFLLFTLGMFSACASGDPQDDAQCTTPDCLSADSTGNIDQGGLDLSIDPLGADSDDTGTIVLGGFGDPCDSDDMCESRYCIESDEGWICTMLCNEECPEGFVCVFVVNSGADAVRICVPEREVLCEPCEFDTDCFGFGAYCLEQLDGDFCATSCENEPCPEHYLCNPVLIEGAASEDDDIETDLCVPEFGICSDCLDGDGDGYGEGFDCLGTDCNDASGAISPAATEICNEIDDNCNDETDEGFDLTSDPENCGACGLLCETENGTPACLLGECVVGACDEGYADCDGLPENGCEVDLSLPENCGSCPGGETTTLGTACGTCDSGTWTCDETLGLTCTGDMADDALNACGGCGLLAELPGESCGSCGLDTYACDGSDAVTCSGDTTANACGGCELLDNPPGTLCGSCELDAFECTSIETTLCSGDTTVNPCGGCTLLDSLPGDACGTCDSGSWVCDTLETLYCEGDLGDTLPPSCVVLHTARFGWFGGNLSSEQHLLQGSGISDRFGVCESAEYRATPFPVDEVD